MLILRDVSVSLDNNDSFKNICSAELKTDPDNIISCKIIRKSIDARKKHDLHFVYTFEVVLKNNESKFERNCKKASAYVKKPIDEAVPKRDQSLPDPVIVGSGPAGLFCALELIKYGYRPIIIERGEPVGLRTETVKNFWNNKVLNENSNIQFGEGGAGTFSDGKLNTGTNSPYKQYVLETFVKFGAPDDILYDAEPHIGTDILQDVVKNIRDYITDHGGRYYFSTKFVDFKSVSSKLISVSVESGGSIQEIECDRLILAVGHSSRDTITMLKNKGIPMVSKAFSIGARIEHLQSDINKSRYGQYFDHPKLGAASYKLSAHLGDRGVYTFCMCPGGYVVAATSEKNSVVTNGMSYNSRNSSNANSAILVGVTPADFGSDDPLAGIWLQQKIERSAYEFSGGYCAPCQRVGDFLKRKQSEFFGSVTPTYTAGVTPGNLDAILPGHICDTMRAGITEFGKRINGFDNVDSLLTGPETRSSSPVRLLRNDRLQTSISGIYPCGEGAGYSGGITSSAVDGIAVARAIISDL